MARPTASPTACAVALAALLGGAAPVRAHAALAVHASVEELARTSDAVVRGRVERRASFRAGSRIYTDVTIRAAGVWRGTAPATVRVRVPGGAVGNVGQRVDGAPVFTDGEEVVVFLERPPEGVFRVNGLAQGKFRVVGASAAPDVGGVRFLRSDVAVGERAAEAMPLAELERRVREAR